MRTGSRELPGVAPVARLDRQLALAMALCALLVYNANLRGIAAGDTFPARFLPLALLHGGTLYLDPVAEAARMGYARSYWIVPARGGRHLASLYPVVTPLVATPLYLPAAVYLERRGWGDVDAVRAAAELSEKLAASVIAAACAGLMFWLLRRRLARSRALLLAVAFAFGTETWVISSQALWQHGVAELLVAVALLALTAPAAAVPAVPVAAVAADTGLPSRRSLAVAGLVAGLLVANRPFDAVLAAAFALAAVCLARSSPGPRRRQVGWFFAAAAVPLLLTALYDLVVFGNLAGGYETLAASAGRELLRQPLLTGLAGELLSPGKGLLVYSPFLVVLVAGGRRVLDRPGRAVAVAGLLAVVAQLLLYAKTDFRAGRCYGPRFLTDLLPLLVWLSAPAVAALRRRGLAAFAAAASFAICVQAVGAFYYPSADSDAWMDVWKLGDAPFLTELAAGRARPLFLDRLRGGASPGARSTGERLQQVGDQVVGVLEADRGAQQVGRRRRMGALGRGAVLDQALGAAQAGGVEEEAQPRGDPQGLLAAAGRAERDHAAEGAHLAARDLVTGVVRQAGIMDRRHLRPSGQGHRHRQGVGGVALHAAGERAQAAQHQPAVEGRGDGAQVVTHPVEARGQLGVAAAQHQGASLHVAMAAEILGGGMQHDVHAEVQRPLQSGRGEGAVHQQQGAVGMGCLGDAAQVEHFEQRVGGCLRPDQPGGGP
jgi:hypothetical protein